MRTTPHTMLKKSVFEIHFGREPKTELSNMLKLNEIKKLQNNNFFGETRNSTNYLIQWRRR